MKLCDHILDSMFEKSLFSDLSLTIDHATFLSTIRFDVHKAIVGQSPFFRLLLDNIDRIPLVKPTVKPDHDINSMGHQQSSTHTSITSSNSNLHLTINLVDAMKQCGFTTMPFQSAPQRQQQTPITKMDKNTNSNNDGLRYILSSHVRFALKWMYSADRSLMVRTLDDKDTLPVLCLAILFGLDGLANECLERYTERQLSIHTIVNDLEIICQLPRKHKAYLQLRNCALLMLLRRGHEHPQHIAWLPVDYMSDVLGADSLYIGCEYKRYCLLREIMVIMQSSENVNSGIMDQRHSRTAQHPNFIQQQQQPLTTLNSHPPGLKRKSLSSDNLVAGNNSIRDGPGNDVIKVVKQKQHRLSRLCFSSSIPFQRLLVATPPGRVINKTTILSYLLRTTVDYSNMSFDQLATVRQDGIVDESIVFKALWQREALERQLFPSNYLNSRSDTPGTSHRDSGKDFDQHSRNLGSTMNDDSTAIDQQSQQRILLDSPRFRFSASLRLALPHDNNHNGWDKVELMNKSVLSESSDPSATDTIVDDSRIPDDGKDDGDNDDLSNDNDESDATTQLLDDTVSSKHLSLPNGLSPQPTSTNLNTVIDNTNNGQHKRRTIYNKTTYTQAEYILGHWHRVRLEAQVLPRSLLQIQDEDDTLGNGTKNRKNTKDANHINYRSSSSRGNNPSALVCRFELQRDHMAQNMTQPQNDTIDPLEVKCKIRYSIYCLNRHEGLVKNDRVDPEDWMLVPITEVTESTDPSTGYVGQVLLDTLENKDTIDVDMMVALEIVAFEKCTPAL